MKKKEIWIVAEPKYLGSFTTRTERTTISPAFWRRLKPIGWIITKIGDVKTTRNKNQIKFEREVSYRRVTLLEHIGGLIKGVVHTTLTKERVCLLLN